MNDLNRYLSYLNARGIDYELDANDSGVAQDIMVDDGIVHYRDNDKHLWIYVGSDRGADKLAARMKHLA